MWQENNRGRAAVVFAVVFTVLFVSCNTLLWVRGFMAPPPSDVPAKKETVTPRPQRDTKKIYGEFRSELEKILAEDAPDFAVYLFYPDLDEKPFCYQSRPMSPASMIKLFVLTKTMEDVSDGKIELDDVLTLKESDMVNGAGILNGEAVGSRITINKLAELMIAESDNTATNMLIDRLGMDEINNYLTEKRYTDTLLQHKMMLYSGGRHNFSSVRDIGDLLTAVYRRECVDDKRDGLMIHYLLKQTDKECFPAALPGWNIAHKTGEVTGVYHDGGIFFGEKENFVLVIMSESKIGRWFVIEKMQKIAKAAAALAEK